jgi:hypothetical protein
MGVAVIRSAVHVAPLLEQRALLRDAETLLLVDDDQVEPREAHVRREECVRADREAGAARSRAPRAPRGARERAASP